MTDYSLDSSFVINFLGGNQKATRWLEGRTDEDRFFLPSLAEAEVRRGVDDLGEFEKLEVQELGSEEAKLFSEISKELRSKGSSAGALDCLIAATAASNSSVLVSFDSDFKTMKGISGVRPEILDE